MRKAGYRVVYQPPFQGDPFRRSVQRNGCGGNRTEALSGGQFPETEGKMGGGVAKQCENDGNPDPFRARERSMGKPIVLVVDHYVPTYDKDAGSENHIPVSENVS